jgi:hypothetical protein
VVSATVVVHVEVPPGTMRSGTQETVVVVVSVG